MTNGCLCLKFACTIQRSVADHRNPALNDERGKFWKHMECRNNCFYTSSATVADIEELFDKKNIQQLRNNNMVVQIDEDNEYEQIKEEISKIT
jgi:hypothetical protein